MRLRGVPTPAELMGWNALASPWSVAGTFHWQSAVGGQSWFSYAGSYVRPMVEMLPANAPHQVWHRAPDEWRIDGVAVFTHEVTLRLSGDQELVHRPLLLVNGPQLLIYPEPRKAIGEVVREDLLGRCCWRWQQPTETCWVDEETGCLLRRDHSGGSSWFTQIEFNPPLSAELFALPADTRTSEAQPEPPQVDQLPEPTFTVPWWPFGTSAWPIEGDAARREVLLELATEDTDLQFWLGLAPTGVPAPIHAPAAHRRWSTEHGEFALSWLGEVDEESIERVITSVPRRWA